MLSQNNSTDNADAVTAIVINPNTPEVFLNEQANNMNGSNMLKLLKQKVGYVFSIFLSIILMSVSLALLSVQIKSDISPATILNLTLLSWVDQFASLPLTGLF